MQNQPGAGPRQHDPAEAIHDRQAARTKEDAFKGGSAGRRTRLMDWLRKPWKPAAGRLFPGKPEGEE